MVYREWPLLSRQRSNACDLTRCLIPKDFPYIAFDDALRDWSHVSLFGFYRLLGPACGSRRNGNGPVYERLIEDGTSSNVLTRMIASGENWPQPIPSDTPWPQFRSGR